MANSYKVRWIKKGSWDSLKETVAASFDNRVLDKNSAIVEETHSERLKEDSRCHLVLILDNGALAQYRWPTIWDTEKFLCIYGLIGLPDIYIINFYKGKFDSHYLSLEKRKR